MSIESLEPRLAPATVTVTHLPGGILEIAGSEEADTILVRSSEPGYLTIGVIGGTLVADGQTVSTGAVTTRTPTGPVNIKLLGGDDSLFIGSFRSDSVDDYGFGTTTFTNSLAISDTTGTSLIATAGVVVRGNLTITGSSGDDLIVLEDRLSVGKDFSLELKGGTNGDYVRNRYGGLDLDVKGNMQIHGTAPQTIIALGLSLAGDNVRPVDDDPNVAEEQDIAVSLRQLRVGGNLGFDVGGTDSRLFIGAGQASIGGKLTARSVVGGADLETRIYTLTSLNVGRGVDLATGGTSYVQFDGYRTTIGGSITLSGATGDDSFGIYSDGAMKLPSTTLDFGAGKSETIFSAQNAWTLAAVRVSAGAGEDSFTVRGAGKIAGGVNASFGAGAASVSMGSGGSGRLSLAGTTSFTSDTGLDVFIYNAAVAGKLNVTGSAGADSLAFDSVTVSAAINFNAGAGADGFYTDDLDSGRFARSVFSGPINLDLGPDADTVILGAGLESGRASFTNSIVIRGLPLPESYTDFSQSGPANDPYVRFTKRPLFLS